MENQPTKEPIVPLHPHPNLMDPIQVLPREGGEATVGCRLSGTQQFFPGQEGGWREG